MSGVGIHPGSLPGPFPFNLGGSFPVVVVGASSPADPPRNFFLGDDHDIVLTTNLVMVAGLESVRQDHECALLAVALFDEETGEPIGEWFLDREGVGVPWFRDILGHDPSLPRIRELIRRKVLSRPGTKAITSMTVTIDRVTREAEITYVASTDLGELRATVVGP